VWWSEGTLVLALTHMIHLRTRAGVAACSDFPPVVHKREQVIRTAVIDCVDIPTHRPWQEGEDDLWWRATHILLLPTSDLLIHRDREPSNSFREDHRVCP